MITTEIESTDLGHVIARFRPGTENVVAGFLLGLLFTGCGAAFAIYATRQVIMLQGDLPLRSPGQSDWIGVVMMACLGVVAILIGIGSFLLVRSQLLSFSVTVCDNGFSCSNQGVRKDFPWDSIVSVHETITHARMQLLGGVKYALPERVSHSYLVHRNDGQSVDFYEDNVKRLPHLITLIRKELEGRHVPWSVMERKG